MEAVFDTVANRYDIEFTFTQVGKRQRGRVWKLLSESHLLDKKSSVLEVNCGTGEDAIRFASLGHSVLATDISSKMIEVCQQKIQDSDNEIEFVRASLNQINTLGYEEKFDIIFSDFGGLNCISPPEFSDFLEDASDLLKTGGSLVMVIMPSFCGWETFYYLFKGFFKKAFRRLRKGTEAVIENHTFPIYYYHPHMVTKMGKPYFKKIKLAPVGSFLPPSYLEHFFRERTNLLNLLERLEKATVSFSFLSYFSDHYYLHLIKK